MNLDIYQKASCIYLTAVRCIDLTVVRCIDLTVAACIYGLKDFGYIDGLKTVGYIDDLKAVGCSEALGLYSDGTIVARRGFRV